MSKKSTIEATYAQIPNDIESIKKLWFDYLVWGKDKMQELHGVHSHDPQETVEQDIQNK